MNEERADHVFFEKPSDRIGEFQRVIRVMFTRWIVIFGIIVVLAFIIIALFAPFIAPYDPIKPDYGTVTQPLSKEHLLGTDELGRDVLSRLIFGTRISLIVAVVGTFISGLVGMLLGLLAGYSGKWVSAIIMRIIDALMALPPIILMLAIAALLGGGLNNVLISLFIAMIPTYCRLAYGEVLSIKENDYITATRSIGANNLRIMMRHIFPNVFPPILVLVTLNMGFAILAEASLSYLGIGINPPTPTWGNMVSNGYNYIRTLPLLSIAPGTAILLLVLAFNIVGDGLRDALDPRLRGMI
jgi:ABC-type dipeptide/oligopeptide/nickel transport system permease subunit